MRQSDDFTTLFAPFTLAGKPLRNRITHAAMSLVSTPEGRVSERMVRYHANRAAGGAALIVTEPARHDAPPGWSGGATTPRDGWTSSISIPARRG